MIKIKKDQVKRITVRGDFFLRKCQPFDIYTDQTIEFLDPIFLDWVWNTKVHTAESFCRFAKKKNRSIILLSENQYLNILQARMCFILYRKS